MESPLVTGSAYNHIISHPQGALERQLQLLLAEAGIAINGPQPWDIQVHDPRLYRRVLAYGSLGAGEAYMDGWWDCARLDEFFYRILREEIAEKVKGRWQSFFHVLASRLHNQQSRSNAFKVGEVHYNLGNDLYSRMLGDNMMYSCGYWKEAATLEEAQQDKLALICKKLRLAPGMSVLDIGCGWGGLAKYMAMHYRVRVVGITISTEQVKLAREKCQGLPVDIRLQDYRDVKERFDRVVSIGMFEHVGYKNYSTYMALVSRCLADDGLFLLHTIGGNTSSTHTDAWIHNYIFPNSMLPSIKQIAEAAEGLFVMEDWHNFSADYDQTLMAWYRNFKRHWECLKSAYDERFYRMWTYYLLTCAASFRARVNQLWQIVFSPKGVIGGYRSIR